MIKASKQNGKQTFVFHGSIVVLHTCTFSAIGNN